MDDANYCSKCGEQLDIKKESLYYFYEQNKDKKVSQTNGMAIAGFVLSFFVPLLGWIFGGIGLARSKDTGTGAYMSVAALIIATIMFIFNLWWMGLI